MRLLRTQLLRSKGNNEPNNRNWYVIFEGEVGGGNKEGKNNWKPVARMQKKLYEDVKADPVLGKDGYNYPVWSLTYGGASGENVGLQYLTKFQEDDMADSRRNSRERHNACRCR